MFDDHAPRTHHRRPTGHSSWVSTALSPGTFQDVPNHDLTQGRAARSKDSFLKSCTTSPASCSGSSPTGRPGRPSSRSVAIKLGFPLRPRETLTYQRRTRRAGEGAEATVVSSSAGNSIGNHVTVTFGWSAPVTAASSASVRDGVLKDSGRSELLASRAEAVSAALAMPASRRPFGRIGVVHSMDSNRRDRGVAGYSACRADLFTAGSLRSAARPARTVQQAMLAVNRGLPRLCSATGPSRAPATGSGISPRPPPPAPEIVRWTTVVLSVAGHTPASDRGHCRSPVHARIRRHHDDFGRFAVTMPNTPPPTRGLVPRRPSPGEHHSLALDHRPLHARLDCCQRATSAWRLS